MSKLPSNSKQKETAQKDRDTGEVLPMETDTDQQLVPLDSDIGRLPSRESELNKQGPAGGPKIHELLLKELDERHHYSRFIAQAFMTWYTFFVTLNLAIMGVSLANADKIVAFLRPFMVISFVIFNFLGVFTTYFIHLGTAKQQKRIDEIISKLNELCGLDPESRASIEMRSPYPHKLFTKLSLVFASSLIVLIISWFIFLIYAF